MQERLTLRGVTKLFCEYLHENESFFQQNQFSLFIT